MNTNLDRYVVVLYNELGLSIREITKFVPLSYGGVHSTLKRKEVIFRKRGSLRETGNFLELNATYENRNTEKLVTITRLNRDQLLVEATYCISGISTHYSYIDFIRIFKKLENLFKEKVKYYRHNKYDTVVSLEGQHGTTVRVKVGEKTYYYEIEYFNRYYTLIE